MVDEVFVVELVDFVVVMYDVVFVLFYGVMFEYL